MNWVIGPDWGTADSITKGRMKVTRATVRRHPLRSVVPRIVRPTGRPSRPPPPGGRPPVPPRAGGGGGGAGAARPGGGGFPPRGGVWGGAPGGRVVDDP